MGQPTMKAYVHRGHSRKLTLLKDLECPPLWRPGCLLRNPHAIIKTKTTGYPMLQYLLVKPAVTNLYQTGNICRHKQLQIIPLREPSLARVVSAAGVQPTRPGSIPVGDDPRVSPGKIPQREAERVCGVC